jgi:hypothetical protein
MGNPNKNPGKPNKKKQLMSEIQTKIREIQT